MAMPLFDSYAGAAGMAGQHWIDGENVILNTSPSLGLGYSEVCQYIVFADGKIQPTNPVRSEVILNMPMKRIR